MSFSDDLKKEIINKFPEETEEQSAALYALLLNKASYIFRGRGKFTIQMDFKLAAGASFAFKLVKSLYSHSGTLSRIASESFGGQKFFRYEVADASLSREILHNYSILDDQGVLLPDLNIDTGLFPSDKAKAAFIQGAFIACGYIYEPASAYEAQFRHASLRKAESFAALLEEFGIESKTRPLKNDIIVYIKKAQALESLLAVINAATGVFRLADTLIYRQSVGSAVREGNLYEANLDRTVEASARQREAIDLITLKGKLSSLSDVLLEAARLRSEYPEETLKELAERAGVSRSTFGKRLDRLIKISKGIK